MATPRFHVQELALLGVLSVAHNLFKDERGLSATTYSAAEFAELGIHTVFVEGYTSRSRKGVVRGLHFQRAPHAQDKLVRCSVGEIYAVAADYDPVSPTYKRHVAVTLSAQDGVMLFIPGVYAFGFAVTGEEALVEYKIGGAFNPESAGGVRYDDPALAIPWPVTEPIMTEKDKQWPLLGA